ncbi:MAG: hypothetical protein GYB68_05200, partial [Chloroflexi bacterium]|nr:hypothetical protein [Chloroflexota bacterium]
VLSVQTKTGFFQVRADRPPTLDGIDFIRWNYPGDYEAIMWLQENADFDQVILEAVGGQYSYHGRVAMATGLPTVIGWAGHQRQWRGDTFDEVAGGREAAVREIYTTPNMQRAMDLIEQYDITYIYVGVLERNPDFASPVGLAKFERFLTPVYQNDGVTIYRADQPRIEEPASQ